MTRTAKIRIAVSISLTVILVWVLLRQVDPREIWTTIRDLHWPPFLAFLVVYFLSVVARTVRYWLLLERRVDLITVGLVTLVRNFAVDLLPARLGSLSYVYLIVRRAEVALERGLSSFFVAFIFDVLALAPLLFLAILWVGGGLAGGTTPLLIAGTALLAGAAFALWALAPGLRLAGGLVGSGFELVGRAPSGWLAGSARKLEATADDVEAISRRGTLVPVFLLSLAVRICKYGGLYLLLLAVLGSHGVTWRELELPRVFLGTVGAELSATLPIQGIAGLGTYETAWALSFTQLGFDRELAVLSGFATHLLTQLHDYSLGLLALLWLMRPGFRPRYAGTFSRRDRPATGDGRTAPPAGDSPSGG